MATLSSEVIAAGARVGEFVRYYETVAELLATTDTLTVGETVRTPLYAYEVVTSGGHITTAGGASLNCLADPYVTPDQFGAPGQGNDETSYVNAAIASGLPVFLNRFYDVTHVEFPANQNGITLHGAGPHDGGLKGTDANSEAILQTCEDGSNQDSSKHDIRNFSIIGVGKRAFAICQIINSTIEMVHLTSGNTAQSPNAFSGADGYVLEVCFANTLRNLESSGLLTSCDMRVNATVLDTIVDLLYTNNTNVTHHIDIDQTRQEVATQAAAGHGILTFNMPTLQGARGYAVKISGTYAVEFHNVYLEANVGAFLVLDCDILNIYGTTLTGTSDAHCVWLDSTKSGSVNTVNFHGCQIQKPMVAGDMRQLGLFGCLGNGIADALVTDATTRLTTATNLTGTNQLQMVSLGERDDTLGGTLGLKCSDVGKHTQITVTEAGVVSGGTAFTPATVDHAPHSPVSSVIGTASPSWTNGLAITEIASRGMGGTAPLVYSLAGDKKTNGALPTGVTINSSTGEISGTPTETGEFRFKVRVTDANGYWDDSKLIVATVS